MSDSEQIFFENWMAWKEWNYGKLIIAWTSMAAINGVRVSEREVSMHQQRRSFTVMAKRNYEAHRIRPMVGESAPVWKWWMAGKQRGQKEDIRRKGILRTNLSHGELLMAWMNGKTGEFKIDLKNNALEDEWKEWMGRWNRKDGKWKEVENQWNGNGIGQYKYNIYLTQAPWQANYVKWFWISWCFFHDTSCFWKV